jgi:hypothetical protein
VILTGAVAAIPIKLYYSGNTIFALLTVGSGSWLAMYVFSLLYLRYELKNQRILRQKIRLLSVAIGVLFVFIMEVLILNA